jgi:hypothetical protein
MELFEPRPTLSKLVDIRRQISQPRSKHRQADNRVQPSQPPMKQNESPLIEVN